MLELINIIAFVIGVLGALILTVGIIHSVMMIFKFWATKHKHEAESHELDLIRIDLGRYMILALEFFIAKDIIETLVVPTWNEIGMLAVIVIIRTVLSYYLTKEIHMVESRKIEHRKIDAGIR